MREEEKQKKTGKRMPVEWWHKYSLSGDTDSWVFKGANVHVCLCEEAEACWYIVSEWSSFHKEFTNQITQQTFVVQRMPKLAVCVTIPRTYRAGMSVYL